MAHWADTIAERIIRQQTGNPSLTLASGISPSGPVHVGNLRDIVTIWFAAKALQDRNVAVRLIHSWDDFDRFRKVPENVPKSFIEFIGKPLSKVPDPNDRYPSYAARYEAEFESSILELGITPSFLRQTELYESGIYSEAIHQAVQARGAIYDILLGFKTQAESAEAREAFFPLTIYCDGCGKDTTRIIGWGPSETEISYACEGCKHHQDLDIKKARNIKLPWKVDWAMRWRHEGVVFEPGGKDHATAGGSFEVSSEIARKIFHYDPPLFQPYEFIGLKGVTGKMSGSSGLLLTPKDALAVYQPELLLWVFAKTPPNRAFDLILDEGIQNLYDAFDRANQIEPPSREIAISKIQGRTAHPVPFKQLVSFCGIVDGNLLAMETIFNRMGILCRQGDFEERLGKATSWILHYAPTARITLLKEPDQCYFKALSPSEQGWVADLYMWLINKDPIGLDEVTHQVYEIPKQGLTEASFSDAQHRFFQIIYNLLFGRDKGPRLGTFLSAVPKESYLKLLNLLEVN
jgi:lysyl-tRNA synthetase class 1